MIRTRFERRRRVDARTPKSCTNEVFVYFLPSQFFAVSDGNGTYKHYGSSVVVAACGTHGVVGCACSTGRGINLISDKTNNMVVGVFIMLRATIQKPIRTKAKTPNTAERTRTHEKKNAKNETYNILLSSFCCLPAVTRQTKHIKSGLCLSLN